MSKAPYCFSRGFLRFIKVICKSGECSTYLLENECPTYYLEKVWYVPKIKRCVLSSCFDRHLKLLKVNILLFFQLFCYTCYIHCVGGLVATTDGDCGGGGGDCSIGGCTVVMESVMVMVVDRW